jgi:enamine deaminase RidA (YjgF/YER057c/UK114 family)
MSVRLAILGFAAASAFAQQPPGLPESPAVLGGGYLYISAQGAGRDSAEGPRAQAGQALRKVIAIAEALGLSSRHIVYTQVYLTNVADLPAVDEAFVQAFPQEPPARAVLGVAGTPYGDVAINAVAVLDPKGLEPVRVAGYGFSAFSAGVLTPERLFLSSIPPKPGDPSTQVDRALDAFQAIAEAAGLDLGHVVFVNPYLTGAIPYRELNEAYAKRFEFGNTPGRATIFVSGLPWDEVTFTGVAVRDLDDRVAVRPKNMQPSPTASPCVLAGDTLFCSAKSGFIPGPNSGIYAGDVKGQLRQTMRNLLAGLEEAEMSFEDVVSTTIYLDDLSEMDEVDAVYAEYFEAPMPARTVVQQLAPNPESRQPDERGRYGTLEQISLIAVRKN